MSTHQELAQTQLPLNRKERFYTGTVLPMIIAKDNFRHIHLLFSLLGIDPIVKICSDPLSINIQFFTEYSLLESLYGTGRTFKNIPSTKDTPDLVFLIDGPPKIIIAIEAKMYNSTSHSKLASQMMAQTAILNSINRTLNISATYHFALLPHKLAVSVGNIGYPIITWEVILETFKFVAKDDYFFTLLNHALDSYDHLVSKKDTFGKNNEEYMIGNNIYKAFKDNSLKNIWMGRKGGLTGSQLVNDLSSGKWRWQVYETRKSPPPQSNRNWFLVEEFVYHIDTI